MLENAGKMVHFTFTYEKVNKADSLQPFGCNGPLVLKTFVIFYGNETLIDIEA